MCRAVIETVPRPCCRLFSTSVASTCENAPGWRPPTPARPGAAPAGDGARGRPASTPRSAAPGSAPGSPTSPSSGAAAASGPAGCRPPGSAARPGSARPAPPRAPRRPPRLVAISSSRIDSAVSGVRSWWLASEANSRSAASAAAIDAALRSSPAATRSSSGTPLLTGRSRDSPRPSRSALSASTASGSTSRRACHVADSAATTNATTDSARMPRPSSAICSFTRVAADLHRDDRAAAAARWPRTTSPVTGGPTSSTPSADGTRACRWPPLRPSAQLGLDLGAELGQRGVPRSTSIWTSEARRLRSERGLPEHRPGAERRPAARRPAGRRRRRRSGTSGAAGRAPPLLRRPARTGTRRRAPWR